MTDTEITPWISNGTCYLAASVPSDPIYIPCGNDAFGHKTCCQAGDKCLENNACYNFTLGITYLLGCSDPDYEDETCPDKKGVKNGGWVGLVTCSGSNDWMPCSQNAKPTTLASADKCSCDPTSHIVAFRAASSIPDVGLAPHETGQTFSWASSHLPTVTVLPTATPTPSSASASSSTPSPTGAIAQPSLTMIPAPTQTVIITASPSPPPPPDPATGLSAGAKAGIGVGVCAAGLAILAALLYFLILLPRRRKQRLQDSQEGAPFADTQSPEDMKYQPVSPKTPGTYASTTTPSELDTGAARPWSIRSELPNDSPSMGTVCGTESRNASPVVGQPTGLGLPQSSSPLVGHSGAGVSTAALGGGHAGSRQGQPVVTRAELHG